MKPILSCLTLALICAAYLMGQESTKPPDVPIPKDGQSLLVYYKAMLRAYKRGDTARFHQLVSYFELPHKDAWIKDKFAADQVTTVSTKYSESFEDFSAELVRIFGQAPGPEAAITITPIPQGGGFPPPANSPAPKTKVLMESYKFELTLSPNATLEWMTSYVQVGGGLRYIGGGAYPFWEQQTRRVKP